MMEVVVMGSGLFVAALVQSVAPLWVAMGRAGPPLVLSIVVYYGLNRSSGLMLTAAFAGGVLSDGLDAMPLGTSALCFCVIGAMVRSHRDIVFIGGWVTHMLFGAAAGASYVLMLYLVLVLVHPVFRSVPLSWVAAKITGTLVLGAFVMPLVFRGMNRLDGMMGNLTMADVE